MKIEIGKLYRIKGNVPIRTDTGYIKAAYLYAPRDKFYDKEAIWSAKPIVENDTVVMVIHKPMYPNHDGVHILLEDKIYYVKNINLIPYEPYVL